MLVSGWIEPVAQESVVDSALLRSNLRPFKTAFLYTSCTQMAFCDGLDWSKVGKCFRINNALHVGA
jgi:hypothetical protein